MRFRTLIELTCALFLLAVAIVAYVSWFTSVSALSAEAALLEERVRALSKSSLETENLEDRRASLVVDETTARGYLLEQQEIVSFLEQLEERGATYGAKVDVVSVSAQPGAAHIELSLRITGTFDAVLRMLGTVEYSSYESRIQSMALNVRGDTSPEARMWVATAELIVGAKETAER